MERRAVSTKEKYNRLAKRYDLMEFLPESLLFARFRKALFSRIERARGGKLLEVGVGTGKNIPYYPKNAEVIAVDFSEEMMKRARRRAEKLRASVDLRVMDVEALGFEDRSFDAVAATFVFCSVRDPVQGLLEVKRVLKPEGTFYALEHVRPKGKTAGRLFDRLAPAVEERTGVNINRETVANIRQAGFEVELEKNLVFSVFKMIVARPAR